MTSHHAARRNSVSGGGNHRMTSTASIRGISLCEALEAGRKTVPPGTEDRSLSLSSGYTADPSEFTERSVSSSVCLSETGQAMVSTRMYSPKYSRKMPSFLPPPPLTEGLTEGEAEVYELPRKPKSIRRSSMFGSTTSISNSIHETAKKTLNSNMTKPRRRSFFGSGATIDQDLPNHQPQSEHLANKSALHLDLHDKIVESPASLPRSSARSTFFNVSCRSINKDGTEESCDNRSTSTRNSKSKSGRKIAKFFSHIRKTHNEDPASSGDISKATMDSIASHELEALPEQGKKHRSGRRHSLFGGVGGAEKHSQEETVASHSLTRPPPTPAHPRRRRRSLFGNAGAEMQGVADPLPLARSTELTKHQKPGFQRLLGKGTETETAALTPRINNPYELVNNERIRRKLHPFIRSMLLDSVAKDVALQLSRSNGARCRPTDYHGNIGKGVDVWTIHEKMMAQKGTEKSNIISSQFYHYGIGIARDREGQIYLCQLFQ
ncbi:hypothetical protein IV203_028770 [Nitzschia inconspicua]|uniref:Uncharacterized protein n=1 Tax=Nitzschia inconspicua TaxID=303405 RepID=A0A9K3Q0L4_9STRA|nr:hypothetical protein IV203_028770 [Nitzschia inconspicua]